ncbi:MAG: hypothetical protein ACOX6U_00240 [Oscillospiraceae bacterium]|jgi:hypothetical protein
MKKKRIIRLITIVLLALSVPLMMGATEFSDNYALLTILSTNGYNAVDFYLF